MTNIYVIAAWSFCGSWFFVIGGFLCLFRRDFLWQRRELFAVKQEIEKPKRTQQWDQAVILIGLASMSFGILGALLGLLIFFRYVS